MILKDKVIIITGASDGLGKQIALKLARNKTHLVLIARNIEKLAEVKNAAIKLGSPQVNIYPLDICDTDKLDCTIKQIISNFKHIDVLINDAGIWQKMLPAGEIEHNVIDEVIQTNLTAQIHCTRLVLPHLKKRKEAAIINIVSKSGVVAQENQSVYTASKYGMHGFTEVLKAELKGTNIRVAGVYQSGVNTNMFSKVGDNPPLEKFINPSDLAEVVVFMLSQPPKIWLHDVRVEY